MSISFTFYRFVYFSLLDILCNYIRYGRNSCQGNINMMIYQLNRIRISTTNRIMRETA